MSEKKFYAVSNAHLDTQWNWTIQDTIRNCIKNTLDDNFRNIENTENYKMNFEGAFRYKLMKEYYPEKYEKLKEVIKNKRWYVSGAFWESCDVNVPSSEALMRQALLGNRYFEEEFNEISKDIFLPDCFGFRRSVPSIAKHMGLIGFSTQKLTWGVGCPIYNEDNSVRVPMPEKDCERMDLGKWEGPDGSRIFVALNGGSYTNQFGDYETPLNDRENYLNDINYNEKHTGFPYRSLYFGVGDEGGGCSLDCAKFVSDAVSKKDGLFDVVCASTFEMFEDLEKQDTSSMPVYNGHLHIPHGFGALSSHTISKRWNRKCELLADSAERAAVAAYVYAGQPYPKERLNTAWKTFLWHQFHDDITGTSICSAYVFSYNDYVIALNMFAAELSASVEQISELLDTNTAGTPVIVYNPTASSRRDIVKAEINISKKYARVFDENNNEIKSQISEENGTKTLVFTADVDPVSFTVYSYIESDTPCTLQSSLKVTDNSLENAKYKVIIDENGDISSVFDKELDKELLSAPSRLEITEDNSVTWPSWELNFKDTQTEPEYVKENVKTQIVSNGPALVSIKITRTHKASIFEQTVSLYDGSDRVDVENKIDWRCRNSLLKASFPLTASNPIAEFDLGLGAEPGANTDSYPYFQHCVHTWADLTDKSGSFGVTVMNDCKYGMDKPNDSTLRLTLIHTPVGAYSNMSHEDWQDMGRNEFAYSISSHEGARSNMALEAQNFNQPLMPFASEKHSGNTNKLSLLSINNNDILVKAVKLSEDNDSIIVRVQETLGKEHENVSLNFNFDVNGINECNGYEKETGKAACADNRLTFDITHFAPKTFSVATSKTANSGDCASYSDIKLDYNKKITTCNNNRTSEDFNITIPEELFEEKIISSQIPFALGSKTGKNALVCKGQKIFLPENTKEIHILASSLGGDKDVCFRVGSENVTLKIQDMYENVGSWDILAKGTTCRIKRDEIAHTFTHTHDKDGDRLYLFAYAFRYTLPVNGACEITLPCDNDIVLFAATASNRKQLTKAAYPLYDVAEKREGPYYKLTVNGAGGSGMYTPGVYLLESPLQPSSPDFVFDHWEGDNIILNEGDVILVRITDSDVTVTAVEKYLGKNHTYGKKATASDITGADEDASHAVNGITIEKWCGDSINGISWLEVDLGGTFEISRWLVCHCGKFESAVWNTSDFELQYKLSADDEWKTADKVESNKDNVTLRDIEPIKASYVRLYITKPSTDNESHARIFEFSVFRK